MCVELPRFRVLPAYKGRDVAASVFATIETSTEVWDWGGHNARPRPVEQVPRLSVMESPQRPFVVSVHRHGDEATLVLVGDLDMASAVEVERAVREAQVDGRLVVDLGEVDFIDSSGLRLLLSLRNAALRNGRTLTLVAPGPEAGRIFTLTGTRGLFDWQTRD